MRIELECDFNVGDTIYFVNSERYRSKCLHCQSFVWEKEDPVILKAVIDHIGLEGEQLDHYALNAQKAVKFAIKANGVYFTPAIVFKTYEEAEQHIFDEDCHFNFEQDAFEVA